MSDGAPVLSLRELQANDPGAHWHTDGETDCLCPLPGCAGKSATAAHRSLSVNTATGEWHCARCKAGGLLAEWQNDRPSVPRRERARVRLRQFCDLPPATQAPTRPADAQTAGQDAPEGPPACSDTRKLLSSGLGKPTLAVEWFP